jgi:ABC-2 type transport system ATP-binding protein
MSQPEKAPPQICIRGLGVRFGRNVVLDDVDLEVTEGTTTVLLGPNGAGKSTLLRTCLGAVKRFAGVVDVAGQDPARKPHRVREAVGYVPDMPDVYGWMTVRDLFAYLRPHYRSWDDEEATAQAKRLDVPMGTPFRKMSRGQGMKAMLAAALAPKPRVLLLDEPFGGLDPLIREEVLRNVIGAIGAERTVLVATHDLEVAARVADRVAMLANGKIRREGPVDELGVDATPTPAAARLHQTLAVAAEECA